MTGTLGTAYRSVRWYLKAFTGEAKWDEYLASCARDGIVPMSRRQYERERADHREHHRQSRCC